MPPRTVVAAGPGAAARLARALADGYGAAAPEARATHEKSPAGFAKARGRSERGESGAVGVLVRRPPDDALLWVRMAPHTGWPPDAWALPGGGVEPGESFEAAAEREVLEETGLSVVVERPLLLLRQDFTCGDERIPDQPFLFVGARVVDEDAPRDPSPRAADVVEARWFVAPPEGAFDKALVERALVAWERG